MRFVVEMAGTAVTSRASATSLSPRTGRDTVCCSDRRRAPVWVDVTSCRSTNANPLPTPTRIPTTGGYVTLASQRTTTSLTLPTRLPAASRTRRPSRWANEIVWSAIVRRAAIRSCKAADTAPRRVALRLSGAANVASPRFSDAPEMRAQNAPTVPAILPARARRGGCFGGNADAIRPTPSEILSRPVDRSGRWTHMPKCVRCTAATASGGPLTSTCAAAWRPKTYRRSSPGGPLSRAVGSPG